MARTRRVGSTQATVGFAFPTCLHRLATDRRLRALDRESWRVCAPQWREAWRLGTPPLKPPEASVPRSIRAREGDHEGLRAMSWSGSGGALWCPICPRMSFGYTPFVASRSCASAQTPDALAAIYVAYPELVQHRCPRGSSRQRQEAPASGSTMHRPVRFLAAPCISQDRSHYDA